MSLDPQTEIQIKALWRDSPPGDERPLLVLDVDDVLLHFVGPLIRYLEAQGARLNLATFRLFGNVFDIKTWASIDNAGVEALLHGFFAAQSDWQMPVDGALKAVSEISSHAEVVLLTAMPHRHRDRRRILLDRIGLPYPLLTTETPKGPAIRRLRGENGRPVAFVDDMPHNLVSARQEVGDSHLFHLIADNKLRAIVPPPPPDATIVMDWVEAGERIAAALKI